MQAAFKYRETTPLSGLEAEPSSLQVSAVGPLRDQRFRSCEEHIYIYIF